MAIRFRSTDSARGSVESLRLKVRRRAAWTMAASLTALVLILAVCKVFIPAQPAVDFVTYVPPGDEMEEQQQQQHDESFEPPSQPVSVVVPTVIVSTATPTLAPFTMDADPSLAPTNSLNNLTGGIGGSGLGNGLGGSKKGGMGGKEAKESAFLGTLWDLKRNKDGKPSQFGDLRAAYANQEVLGVESRFYNKNWDTGDFFSYFRVRQKLYSTCFYMPNCEDAEACHAYDPDGKVGLVKSRWIAIYRAKVRAPASGRFRFYGMADSVMAVRFNGQNVLACGLHNLITNEFGAWTLDDRHPEAGKGRELIAYPSCEVWNEKMGGFAPGEIFTVKKGEWYEMQVLISEIGGWGFGFCLLMEDMDAEEKKKTKDGQPLLMLFRTDMSEPTSKTAYESMDPKYVDDSALTDMPYDEDSYIWEAKPIGPDEKMK